MSWRELLKVNSMIADNRMLRNSTDSVEEYDKYDSRLKELYDKKRILLNQMEE